MKTKMKISIIIPAYNEEKRIGRTLEEYGKFFKNLKNKKILDFEIIVVLNGCTDRTEEIVKKAKKKRKEIKYLNFKQLGKGFAIIEGFKDALKRENDLIGFVDADMATSPEAYYELIKNIGNYDGIIGSRWLKGSIIKTKQAILRRLTSRGFNFLVRSILYLPYSDTQCGAKLFKKQALQKVINKIGQTEWAFDIYLLHCLKKEGFKIKEAPTIWEDKKESKLNLIKVPFMMFSGIMRLRLINSPFKFIVGAYNLLPQKTQIHNLLAR